MKNLLIAIDESPFATEVARSGVDFAQILQAHITFIHVVDNRLVMTAGTYTPNDLMAQMRKDGDNLLTKLKNLFQYEQPKTILEEGNPGEIVIKQANKLRADTIVIGTHGRTGLSRLVMGSVAEEVIRHAQCPVLVIPIKTLNKH